MLSALVGKADNMQGQMASVIQKTVNLTENETLEMENTRPEMKDASESLRGDRMWRRKKPGSWKTVWWEWSKLKAEGEKLSEIGTEQELKIKTASKSIGMLITRAGKRWRAGQE